MLASEVVRNSDPLMLQLRDQTRVAHAAAERSEYARAILGQRLTPAAYETQLAAYREIYAALERALATTPTVCVAEVWRPQMAKLSHLELDLHQLRRMWGLDDGGPHRANAAAIARSLTESVFAWLGHAPHALLGPLYVLEGSTLGARILRPHVLAALGLESQGANYFNACVEHGESNWKQFKTRMNGVALDADQRRQVVEAAKRTFESLTSLFDAISPLLAEKSSQPAAPRRVDRDLT